MPEAINQEVSGESGNRPFKAVLYFSGKRVYQELTAARHGNALMPRNLR
jgi:hypothetical protein